MQPRRKRILRNTAIAIVVGFGLIQLVPYGRAHDNPPVVSEPPWDRPETRALAVRACFDCHSNETTWPWYSHVAPMSWLVQSHVDDGRRALDFSDWSRTYRRAKKAAHVVTQNEMPLWSYTLMHPAARLSADEQRALADGLAATFGSDSGR
jgi:Haem-binding domain